jgi:hypothetical protein
MPGSRNHGLEPPNIPMDKFEAAFAASGLSPTPSYPDDEQKIAPARVPKPKQESTDEAAALREGEGSFQKQPRLILRERPLGKTGKETLVTMAWDTMMSNPDWANNGLPGDWDQQKIANEVNKVFRKNKIGSNNLRNKMREKDEAGNPILSIRNIMRALDCGSHPSAFEHLGN